MLQNMRGNSRIKQNIVMADRQSDKDFHQFLANVNLCSCSLYVVVRPSVVCLSSVCMSSVCNVRAPYSAD